MMLVLARFVFGLTLAWMSFGVLVVATLAYLRLAGIGVLMFTQERTQHATALGLLVAIVVAAITAAYYLARGLEAALGQWLLGIDTADWLAEPDTLSAPVLIGALMGITLLVALVARVLRPPKDPEQIAAERAQRERAKAQAEAMKAADKKALEKKNAEARSKAAAKTASATKASATRASATKASAANKSASSAKKIVKPPRRAALGTLGLFFLLAGIAIGVFAFTVNPLWPAADASELALRFHLERASRAQWVYATAAGSVSVGLLCILLWLFWRRRD